MLGGDLSFSPAQDSADVWAHQELFILDRTVGTPPDAFAAEGQRWGLPMPNWDRMEHEGHRWWRMRARHAAGLYDLFRVDHVVGLYRTFSFGPNRDEPGAYFPADEGAQRRQGEEVIRAIKEEAGESAIIAEDLGSIPPWVRESLAALGLPGYKVFRWEKENWNTPEERFVAPSAYPESVGRDHRHARYRHAGRVVARSFRGRTALGLRSARDCRGQSRPPHAVGGDSRRNLAGDLRRAFGSGARAGAGSFRMEHADQFARHSRRPQLELPAAVQLKAVRRLPRHPGPHRAAQSDRRRHRAIQAVARARCPRSAVVRYCGSGPKRSAQPITEMRTPDGGCLMSLTIRAPASLLSACCGPRVHIAIAALNCDMYHSVRSAESGSARLYPSMLLGSDAQEFQNNQDRR